MGERGWQTADLSILESLAGPGSLRWTPLRRHFGITAYGVNAYTAQEAGQDVVETHTEKTNGHEELYLVLAGRALFHLDGEELDAPVGTLVFVHDPSVQRSASAAESGTTVLAIGGKPGIHETSEWEYSFGAYGYHAANETERGLDLLREGLEKRGESPRLLYDLACLESLSGQHDKALVHLRRAIEVDERYRDMAHGDSDFDSIRNDRQFPPKSGKR
jgi:hypothetical protein